MLQTLGHLIQCTHYRHTYEIVCAIVALGEYMHDIATRFTSISHEDIMAFLFRENVYLKNTFNSNGLQYLRIFK